MNWLSELVKKNASQNSFVPGVDEKVTYTYQNLHLKAKFAQVCVTF